jgi:hypothetical protein
MSLLLTMRELPPLLLLQLLLLALLHCSCAGQFDA